MPLAKNCTPIIQQLDVSVNKQFKAFIRNKFREYVIQNWENIKVYDEGNVKKTLAYHPPVDMLILSWIYEAYEYMKTKIIKKSKFNWPFV